jgi:hypothetical protein
MTKTILVSTVLALLCVGPTTASAALLKALAFPLHTRRLSLIRTLPICAPLSRSGRLCSRQHGHNPILTTFTKRTG